jgi:ABC-type multidrug transport system fused ATPase/permease subunit
VVHVKALLPLLYSAVAALIVATVLVPQLVYEEIMSDVSSWSSFFTVFGVVYAIIVGFLLATVLTRYGTLAQAIESELNAIECIRDFLTFFDESQAETKAAIQKALHGYAQSIADVEWQEMSQPGTQVNSDTSQSLYELMRACRHLNASAETEHLALAAIVNDVSEVAKMRTRRICLANEQLPPRLRLLVIFMSIVLVVGFAVMGVANPWIHALILVSITVSVHLLSMVLDDLDHPFYGVWNIDRSALDELTQRFASERTYEAPIGRENR